MPRPVHLAGQRLRRRPDKCDAGRRPSGRRIPRRRPSGRRIPRPAASGRTRSLCRSSSSHRNRFAGFRREPCWGAVIKVPVLHFLAFLCGGGITTLRRALHAVETLDAQELRRRIRRFYAAPVLALCGLNLPSSGTHATPAPNRAHSGSHAETRRVLRVDGDDVSGSGIIDTIDPFQADQTVAVALAEGHRNAVSP